jgi:dCMP deaminase
VLAAARFGISVEGGTIYSTMRPCFGCTKELLQARVQAVYFLHDWAHPDADKQAEYARLQTRFPGGIRRLDLRDPEAEWAISALRTAGEGRVDETGHQP